ncbi:MAG: sigma 54-dependent Fis family transcriptional regulator [Labilithrix sp.]|nr:sigma 54-dependent Fis family transcriptional regulator [Labilithrix sp.]MCW5816578.1 sigma 54-dependent Fis family transcriptional regulator [Labilithrix sp.]
MAEPPRPPRPSVPPASIPRPSSPPPAIPRPSSPPSIRPSALPLGRAMDESAELDDRNGPNPTTTPLRALIDIAEHSKLTIVVESDGGKAVGRQVVHEGDVCRIGTHPSNDIALEDPSVSRFHCKIVPDRDGWRVEDSGSLNGTHVQGLTIHSAMLPPDATIAIGNSVIRAYSAKSSARELVPMMPTFGALTGVSKSMRKLFALLEKVAASEINCFIHGESGTGKELVATEIVQRGVRADKPFVVVDCGAISPSLVESELFGHVRGAFTGADRDRVGAFEAADGGTVFLDEIGELPLEVQPKLLRALEQREIRRVGETMPRKVNVRVISATNRDLEREVNKGSFRGDLYFRIAVITVRVPPLRERTEDLPHLIRSFLDQLGASASESLFGPQVIAELAKHEWTGNVRELRNYVERSIVLQSARLSIAPPSGMGMGMGGTPAVVAPQPTTTTTIDVNVPYKVAKEQLIDGFERAYVRAVIAACNGNMTRAARMAGIDRMYLHRLVQKHGSREPSGSMGGA